MKFVCAKKPYRPGNPVGAGNTLAAALKDLEDAEYETFPLNDVEFFECKPVEVDLVMVSTRGPSTSKTSSKAPKAVKTSSKK